MKEIKLGAYIRNDETFNFEFATDLSAHDKTVFVRTVVDTLVNDNAYDSIIRDMIFDFTIVMLFTDIDTTFTKAFDNEGNAISALIPIEQFLEETNVVDIVKANMVDGLLEQLENAVDKSIEYRTGIHPSPIADSLASLFSTLEKKINEIDLEYAMGMVKTFVDIKDNLTVDNIVDAYINSDIHKKNAEEIAESRKKNIKIVENIDKVIKEVVETNKTKKEIKEEQSEN